MVIILERSPFPPAFTVRPGLDVPNVSDDQFVTTAFATCKFWPIILVHGRTPSLESALTNIRLLNQKIFKSST
jgi:hypothetical protein